MDNFYVTLISSASSSVYPDNECANYVTKLHTRLDLNDSWEVGATEIFLPETVCNVANGLCTVWMYYGGKLRNRVILGDMYIPSPQLLLVELNSHVKHLYKFTLDVQGYVVCTPEEDMGDISIRFSPTLSKILGFQHRDNYVTGTINGYARPNLVHGLAKQMCVCSNIVKPQVFGFSTLNVLRCVNLDIKAYIYGAVRPYKFPHVMYVPLAITDIEHISIHIKDIDGATSAFTSGTSTVVLHFRQKIC
jgi:hypothetical protein